MEKQKFRKILSYYYCYLFAPRITSYLILGCLFLWGGYKDALNLQFFLYPLGVLYLMLGYLQFIIFWCRTKKMAHLDNAFQEMTKVCLKDTYFETHRGKNLIVTEYSKINRYFCYKNCIILLYDNYFMGGFNIKHLGDNLDEFKSCLENCGAKYLNFWSIKRWLFIAIILIVICYFIIINF